MNMQNNQAIIAIIAKIIASEGGYADHPNDRGGPTKYGITLTTLTNYFGFECSADDVKALTKRTAYEIYCRDYYQRPNIDELPPQIQAIVLDTAVNCGPKTAVKMLQEVLYACGDAPGKIDGRIGANTIAAAHYVWVAIGNALIEKLVNRRIAYYEQIVKHDETQRVFLPGWIARAESFLPNRA